ncbi:MAG: response regulator transcription factor [Deltaproteobacteria bacterium]|nr:response regulator transcription factor [Deltaproteobacteria bacterium]
MIKILIADDHPVVRRGLRQILGEESDMTVLGEATTSPEVLTKVRQQHYDLVLLDITLPGRGGLEVLKELKHDYPKLPVLILSMHPEDQFGARVLKAGAAGYMTKESAPEILVNAIRKVHGGGKYVSPSLAEKLAFDLEIDTNRPLHERLSDREYQVMCMIASGKTVSEVAKELSLSVKTISTHRARILEKMKMRTNAQLTHYAVKNQLVH